MAQPTYYPDWATEDTTLPSTGQTNKVRPKNSLLTIGWDKGQIPSAEEFNWELNNLGQWIRYLNDEVIAGLPDVYLPKNGTQLTFEGDISGTATWNGDAVTSVTLSSTTLNNATSSPTANTLVKRDNSGAANFSQVKVIDSSNANLYLGESSAAYRCVLGYVASGNYTSLSSLNGTPNGVNQSVSLYSDRIEISNPRSASAQGNNNADLTRKDYVDSQISTNISNLDNTLRSYIDSKSTASFAANGYWKDVNTGTIIQWGSITLPTTTAPQTSGNVTFPITFPNAVYSITANAKINQMNTSTGNISVLACVNGSTSGFTLWADSNSGQDFSIAQPCNWIAIGR